MKNGEEKSYVIADREDASDPDQVSDISEPEIINSSSYSNGGGYENDADNIMLFGLYTWDFYSDIMFDIRLIQKGIYELWLHHTQLKTSQMEVT